MCSLWPLSTALVLETVKPDTKRKQTQESKADLEEKRQPIYQDEGQSFGLCTIA